MTKFTLALIFAIIFIVAAFNKPLIPCNDISFCTLDGENDYFYTSKLSSPWLGGGLAFIIVFLIIMTILNMIFKPKQLIV